MITCGAIILAAGKSSRLGRPKQLVTLNGETLLDRVTRLALGAGYSPVIRVLGAYAGEMEQHPVPAGAVNVTNPDWALGMGSSLAFGVRTILDSHPEIGGLLVLTCDQHRVTALLLSQLRQRLAQSPGRIVICDHGNNVLGPPALFPANQFHALSQLSGDSGARNIIRQSSGNLEIVDFAEGRYDLDTFSDLKHLSPHQP